ncbi:MAG: hypothetical protein AAF386_03825 [Pseudomonadota bacterium]
MSQHRTSKWYRIYDTTLLWLMLTFFAAHMANHIALLWGPDVHIRMMDQLRILYRMPLVEIALIWAIYRQVVAGMGQAIRFPPRRVRGRFRMLTWSGLYLIFFIGVHLSATAFNRYGLGLDTNLYFATAGFRSSVAVYFFVPYYFCAVFAAFAHLGAVVWLRQRGARPQLADWVYRGACAFGLIFASVLTISLSGWVRPFAIPPEYLESLPF